MDPQIFPDFPEPVVDSTPQSSPVVTEPRKPRRSNQTRHPLTITAEMEFEEEEMW